MASAARASATARAVHGFAAFVLAALLLAIVWPSVKLLGLWRADLEIQGAWIGGFAQRVTAVAPGRARDRAGLRVGDVLEFDPGRDADWVLAVYRPMPEQAAPPAVVTERIDSVLREVREAAPRIRERLEGLARLQDQVARLRNRIADGAAEVRKAEQAASAQLLELESAPLWESWSRAARGQGLRQQLAATVDRQRRAIASYLAEEPGILVAGVVMLLLLAGLMFPLRAWVRARAAEEPALRLPERVLRSPFSASLLLSLLGVALLYMERRQSSASWRSSWRWSRYWPGWGSAPTDRIAIIWPRPHGS